MDSRRKLPQLTPHFRIVSFAVLLSACLSVARDFNVWKNEPAGLVGGWRGELPGGAGLFDRTEADWDSGESSEMSPAWDDETDAARDDEECRETERRAETLADRNCGSDESSNGGAVS